MRVSTHTLTTLSNLTALHSADIYLILSHHHHHKRPTIMFAQVLSCALSLAFHATESCRFKVIGLAINHELDDGSLVQCVAPPAWLTRCRTHSTLLLRADEFSAPLAVSGLFFACGGALRTLCLVFCRFLVVLLLVLAALMTSDLLLLGWAHALVHAFRHVCAFLLTQSCKKAIFHSMMGSANIE